ncbi:MAG: hypothetical protein Q7R41_01235 [Phycisphaerales bacterium]|nr:hypothetical protein [Phycisphaerales bacterium]
MVIIRAEFDGDNVHVPPEARGLPPGEVILIFANGTQSPSEPGAWMSASEPAFAKAWDNEDDAAYDAM